MIRWITDRLGTGPWCEAPPEAGVSRIDVRDLVDKAGNDVDAVRAKIAQARGALDEGQRVVICCDYGMSRSNAIAAGILASQNGIPVDTAVEAVLRATGETAIRIDVLRAVRRALGDARADTARSDASCVLVTGASGFVGSALLPRLAEGAVTAIAPGRRNIDLVRDAVRLDLLVKQERPAAFLHLANPRVYSTNASLGESLTLLKNVIDVAVENDLLLVYLSTWEIYSGYRGREFLADENTPPLPGGTYAQTKWLCESLLQHHRRCSGLRAMILRSGPVYGRESDKPKFIWNFLAKARRDEDIVTHRYRNGEPTLDLMHVDDLVEALYLALRAPKSVDLNLGTGRGTSTTAVARELVTMLRSGSRVRQVDVDAYAPNVVMDAQLARKVLGWEPRVALPDGLRSLV